MSANPDLPSAMQPGEVSTSISGGKAQGIDVRLPFDYFGGRVPGSVNLPGLSFLDHVGMVRPDVPVIFICDDGGQSNEAAEAARIAGFIHVSVLEGGMDAWLNAGLDIETISDGVMPKPPSPGQD